MRAVELWGGDVGFRLLPVGAGGEDGAGGALDFDARFEVGARFPSSSEAVVSHF